MVIPFADCIARPEEGENNFPLKEHLWNVGSEMGNAEGGAYERLAFLAGLLHDVGKARQPWQTYIQSQDRKNRVPHSVYGAVLFAYCADFLLGKWSVPPEEQGTLQWTVIRWVRDIMDHHGELKDITENSLPWAEQFFSEELADMDLSGIQRWLSSYFPELVELDLSISEIKKWQQGFRRTWAIWWKQHIRSIKREQMAAGCFRASTAQLIQADRFDAAEIEKRYLTRAEAERAMEHLDEYIVGLASKVDSTKMEAEDELSRLRQSMQQAALQEYCKNIGKRIFTLKLPTGMGKTLTSLKVALTACINSGKQRIVYVAPYLSILSQTTEELRKATGLEVQQHHSLTWSENRKWDEKEVLLLESWQAPIVTTTFNQLFFALFPSRAQQTLRLAGLKGAVLILDEPQIVTLSAWAPFLKMVETFAAKWDIQILFVSATMPPLVGLDVRSVPLVSGDVPYRSRYDVTVQDTPLSEEELSIHLLDRLKRKGHVAVILNTIEDSARVLAAVEKKRNTTDVELVHLNGAMTPLHKNQLIQKLKKHLSQTDHTALHEKRQLLVVSTQIIEAGVDISFDALYRALPVYPSIVQAAGRINRHAQGEKGELIIFPYYRNGEKNTRTYVYQDPILREETDHALIKRSDWSERDFIRKVDEYYQKVFERIRPEASLQKMWEAAFGNWSQLKALRPFEDSLDRLPIFVPWGEDFLGTDGSYTTKEEAAVKNGILRLMDRFDIEFIEEIYEHYEDREWMSRLDFIERKQFMGLMQQFIVPLSFKTAKGLVANLQDAPLIKQITSIDRYSDMSGFAHHIGKEDEGILL